MKKTTLIFFSVSLTLFLASCGSGPQPQGQQPVSPAVPAPSQDSSMTNVSPVNNSQTSIPSGVSQAQPSQASPQSQSPTQDQVPQKDISSESTLKTNPAASFCKENNGKIQLRTNGAEHVYGVCVFQGGNACEEWAMFNGFCPIGGVKISGYATAAAEYCALFGGTYTVTKPDIKPDGNMQEEGNCKFHNGRICNAWSFYDGTCGPVK